MLLFVAALALLGAIGALGLATPTAILMGDLDRLVTVGGMPSAMRAVPASRRVATNVAESPKPMRQELDSSFRF
jgi:hypothetical protein